MVGAGLVAVSADWYNACVLPLWLGALDQALAYAGLGLGVYLTFRVLNFADITVDGSFALGGGVSAVLIMNGTAIPLALLAAIGCGALAGAATALMHTRLGINELFAGILTTTALYSITLKLMGQANIPLTDVDAVGWLPDLGLGSDGQWLVALTALAALLVLVLWLLLSTDLGLAMRAIGNSATMPDVNGVSRGTGLVVGLAISNGLVGLAGALLALYQGFADVTMGIGSLVLGLGAVIIGLSILRPRKVIWALLAVVFGGIVFRAVIALALQVGLDPVYLKLTTAVLLLLAIALGKVKIPGVDAGRRT
jgi:putative ABC transport system permease protein